MDRSSHFVHGISQARILEWVAIPFSRGLFLTPRLNLGCLHCTQILYSLSHLGNPYVCKYSNYLNVKYLWSIFSSTLPPWKVCIIMSISFFSLLFICLAVLGLSCGTWYFSVQHTDSLAVAHRFSRGSMKPQLLWGTWDQIHIPCIARQILSHWTTRGVPHYLCVLREETEAQEILCYPV